MIVSGGNAGLSLARVLKARNVPSIVLDRLGYPSGIRDHGVGFRKWAYKPLYNGWECITLNEFRATTAVDALNGRTGNIERPLLDTLTGDPTGSAPESVLTAKEYGYYQASYARVREILYEGLDVWLSHDVQALVPRVAVAKVLC